MNNQDNEKVFQKSQINWFPGHMAKTKREIKEKINLIDVVLEIIDARMPISSKIVDIEDLIGTKKRILIMSKYDLCDKKETEKFVNYYKDKGYKVITADFNKNDSKIQIINACKDIMKGEEEKRKSKGLKLRNIRALIVGVPNVGKSTLINRLVGKNAAGVANKPGHTKSLSWIRINKDIDLLDSPGILWSKLENQENAHILASLSSIKEEIIDKQDLACFILKKMIELYPDNIYERYGIKELDETFEEAFLKIATKRGALQKGGISDYEKVYNIIINDLKNNNLGNITLDRLN